MLKPRPEMRSPMMGMLARKLPPPPLLLLVPPLDDRPGMLSPELEEAPDNGDAREGVAAAAAAVAAGLACGPPVLAAAVVEEVSEDGNAVEAEAAVAVAVAVGSLSSQDAAEDRDVSKKITVPISTEEAADNGDISQIEPPVGAGVVVPIGVVVVVVVVPVGVVVVVAAEQAADDGKVVEAEALRGGCRQS